MAYKGMECLGIFGGNSANLHVTVVACCFVIHPM